MTSTALPRVLMVALLLVATACTANAQRYALRLTDTKYPSGKIYRTIFEGSRVRIVYKSGADSDDYFSTARATIRRAKIEGFEPGYIVLRDGTSVNIDDIATIYNLSAGRTERALSAAAFVGSTGLAILASNSEDPLIQFSYTILAVLGYGTTALGLGLSALSDSKAYDLTSRWRPEVVEFR